MVTVVHSESIALSRASRAVRALASVAFAYVCMCAGAPGVALGHQASITHASADISEDRRTVDYQLEFEPPDVSEALGLGVDVNPTDDEVRVGADRLMDYVLARVHFESGGRACPVERAGEGLGVRTVEKGSRFVQMSVRMRCDAPIEELAIEYDLFFDIDPLHRNILRVRFAGERAVAELDEEGNRFVWNLGEAPPSDLLGFVKSGVEHIAFGFDHIAFLIGLLLVVTIALRPPDADAGADADAGSGADATWHVRDLMGGLRYTALIVTSFTIAHSITLIAASLEWIELSSRVVESLIAASIAYVAIENIVWPQTRYRYVVTFVFGLMHGMGFASMLAIMLPPEDVIGPLLAFNVGVELGQLFIVIVFLPVLHLATRAMGARAYREWVLPMASGLLALIGLAWLIERVFETTIVGF